MKKAIVKNWYDGTGRLVYGKIVDGLFEVESITKEQPNFEFEHFETVPGSNHFRGATFRSNFVGGKYVSTFYIVPDVKTEYSPMEEYSEVAISSSVQVSDEVMGIPSGKPDYDDF